MCKTTNAIRVVIVTLRLATGVRVDMLCFALSSGVIMLEKFLGDDIISFHYEVSFCVELRGFPVCDEIVEDFLCFLSGIDYTCQTNEDDSCKADNVVNEGGAGVELSCME